MTSRNRRAVIVALLAEALLLAALCGLAYTRVRQPAAGVAAMASMPEAAAIRESVPPSHRVFFVPLPPIPPLRGEPHRANREAYRPLLRRAAWRHRLSPDLVEAIASVESDFNPREVSPKGALGIMQVMPETAARFGVARHELLDPERNAAAGTAYLAWLLQRYHGDVDLALAAYNAGEEAVHKYGGIPPYAETQQYVRRVRAVLSLGN